MDSNKVAFFTCVTNFSLYDSTRKFYPKGVKLYAINGQSGIYGIKSITYIINRLKKTETEWLVLIDEDSILLNSAVIFDIISFMKLKNMTACGMRDGGLLDHRRHNPFVLNTFFNIINFKEVIRDWNEHEMLANQFVLENEFEDNLESCPSSYDKLSLFEPYYCFYLWLRRLDKNILFLDSKTEKDNIANKLYFKQVPFILHTWYGRHYGIRESQTKRIDNYINNTMAKNDCLVYNDYTILKPTSFLNYINNIKKKLKAILFDSASK